MTATKRRPSPTVVMWAARALALALVVYAGTGGSSGPLLVAFGFFAGGWEGVARAARWDDERRALNGSSPHPAT